MAVEKEERIIRAIEGNYYQDQLRKLFLTDALKINDVYQLGQFRSTPLMYAIEKGKFNVAVFIINNLRADVRYTIKNTDGTSKSALTIALDQAKNLSSLEQTDDNKTKFRELKILISTLLKQGANNSDVPKLAETLLDCGIDDVLYIDPLFDINTHRINNATFLDNAIQKENVVSLKKLLTKDDLIVTPKTSLRIQAIAKQKNDNDLFAFLKAKESLEYLRSTDVDYEMFLEKMRDVALSPELLLSHVKGLSELLSESDHININTSYLLCLIYSLIQLNCNDAYNISAVSQILAEIILFHNFEIDHAHEIVALLLRGGHGADNRFIRICLLEGLKKEKLPIGQDIKTLLDDELYRNTIIRNHIKHRLFYETTFVSYRPSIAACDIKDNYKYSNDILMLIDDMVRAYCYKYKTEGSQDEHIERIFNKVVAFLKQDSEVELAEYPDAVFKEDSKNSCLYDLVAEKNSALKIETHNSVDANLWPSRQKHSRVVKSIFTDALKSCALAYQHGAESLEYKKTHALALKRVQSIGLADDFNYLLKFIEYGCTPDEIENFADALTVNCGMTQIAFKIALSLNLMTEDQLAQLKKQEAIKLQRYGKIGYPYHHTTWTNIFAENPGILYAMYRDPDHFVMDTFLRYTTNCEYRGKKVPYGYWPILDQFKFLSKGIIPIEDRRLYVKAVSLPPWTKVLFWDQVFMKTPYYKEVYVNFILKPMEELIRKYPNLKETIKDIERGLHNEFSTLLSPEDKCENYYFNIHQLNEIFIRGLTRELKKKSVQNSLMGDGEETLYKNIVQPFLKGALGSLIVVATLFFALAFEKFRVFFFTPKSYQYLSHIKWALQDVGKQVINNKLPSDITPLRTKHFSSLFRDREHDKASVSVESLLTQEKSLYNRVTPTSRRN